MKIGILGGGQLGRMLALAGYPLGLNFVFYDPQSDCCAKDLGKLICGSYSDEEQLYTFAQCVDVITYENENIPVTAVNFLKQYKSVFPDTNILHYSQDRLQEKQLFNALDIPTVKYLPINNQQDLLNAASQLNYPFIVKTRRQGYDGKGQTKIFDHEQCRSFSINTPNCYIAEQYIKFDREVSLIATRNIKGECVFYDICENTHQNAILIQTLNKPNDPIFKLAKYYVEKVLDKVSYIGTFTIEFFQIENELVANEMAPRVHNSGHWSIEGAIISQFENHLRAILDWPLGNTQSLGHAVMQNMIGVIPNKFELLRQPGLHLHDYGKEPRTGRKLGHYTIINK